MNKWVKIRKNGIIGLVVAKKRLPTGLVFGLDLNGEGGIFYIFAREVEDLPDGKCPGNGLCQDKPVFSTGGHAKRGT